MKSTDTDPDEPCRITVPPHIAERLRHRLERTTFDSTEEYAVFALECLLDAIEENEDLPGTAHHESTTPEDVGGVEDRLESLGYL